MNNDKMESNVQSSQFDGYTDLKLDMTKTLDLIRMCTPSRECDNYNPFAKIGDIGSICSIENEQLEERENNYNQSNSPKSNSNNTNNNDDNDEKNLQTTVKIRNKNEQQQKRNNKKKKQKQKKKKKKKQNKNRKKKGTFTPGFLLNKQGKCKVESPMQTSELALVSTRAIKVAEEEAAAMARIEKEEKESSDDFDSDSDDIVYKMENHDGEIADAEMGDLNISTSVSLFIF